MSVAVVLFLVLLAGLSSQQNMPSPFYRVLQLEDPPLSGSDVYIMQNLLTRSPYVGTISVNGHYDSKTESAVASFQNGNSIVADPSGVFGPTTANTLLSLHSCDGYIDDNTPAGTMGYLYKVFIQVFNNRSLETKALLLDSNNTVLLNFRVRLHGKDNSTDNGTWPEYSNTVGLNQFSSNGNTPTGLMEFDLNSPEDNSTLYGPFPVNRAINGLRGNAAFLMTNARPVRSGILLHTGIWPNWNRSEDMPNSEGCIHAHPSDVLAIWQILTKKLGVAVHPNPFGQTPYPYQAQGLLSIEQVGCQ